MILTYLLLSVVILLNIRINRVGYNENFTGKEQSNVIKGVFIWFVFISHITQYIPDIQDSAFNFIRNFLGQLVVVPFLFYSGYGVLTNINRGGYVETIPKKRILNTLVNFDVAVVLFIITDILLGKDLTIPQCLLSLICWDSVGNSNWYIFSIIICYLLSYVSAKVFGCAKKGLIAICVSVFVYSVVMAFLKEGWWYDTVWSYAGGAFYCYYKEQIDSFCQKKYFACLFSVIVSFLLSTFIPNIGGVSTNIRSLFFMAMILLFTMKLAINNQFLSWSGKNLFPLYIYQRIPMLIFSTVLGGAMVQDYLPIYIVVCFTMTLIITKMYPHFNVTFK